jgi:hypothetical protein
MERASKTTPTLTVALAWLVVTLPLGWGVYQSVVNSRPLFQVTSTSQQPSGFPAR